MESELLGWIQEVTGATSARRGERIQSLWGGYGEIVRVHLTGAPMATAILKAVRPPERSGASSRVSSRGNSRGNTTSRATTDDRGHARKCRSYDVEATWYRTLAARCDDACRVPALIGCKASKDRWLLLLEDLDAAGYAERRHDPKGAELDACLAWLAAFHARFLGIAPDGLWKAGTYWHLATRPDELAAIDDVALREAAPLLDRRLREGAFKTLVHGDAKPANFCFSRGTRAVAAVDFQYVGGGSGMKDVAYLLCGRAISEDLERRELDAYFRHLRAAVAVTAVGAAVTAGSKAVDVDALELEWRTLYPIACADFYRFLAGWSKEHWRSDAHGQRLVRRVLASLA